MEARMLVGLAALAAAFIGAYAAVQLVGASVRRGRAAAVAQGGSGEARGLVAWRLRNGFSFAMPAARLMLRYGRVARLADGAIRAMSTRGAATTPEALLSTALVASLVSSGAVGLVSGSLIAGTATLVCLWAVATALVQGARDKNQDAVRESVPEALASMAVCFGSGFTLLQTFKQVATDVPGPLGKTFARSAHMLEMGASAEDALEELRNGSSASELAFVAVALDVQHQSGGAMGQVLDAATDAVKGELALRRSLRVQTAQAKLSARVVSVMPFVLIAAFSLASPDFLAPFFASPFGYALLALAVIMQASGILLVRRALTVEGVS